MLSFAKRNQGAVGLCALLFAAGIAPRVHANATPEPIKSLEAQGVEIVESFQAPGGLRGYIGRYRQRAMEIYLTEDGRHAIVGTMIDGAGEPVAAEKLMDAMASDIDWNSLEDTHWIADGDPDGQQIVYAFIDPNCPYCGVFWQASREYLKTPGVQLRFIMVGMLRPSSEGLAAEILAADDPVAALAQHEQRREQGEVREPGRVANRFLKEVRDNTSYMRSQDIYATPTVVFKDRNGRVQVVQGVPSEELMKEEIFRQVK